MIEQKQIEPACDAALDAHAAETRGLDELSHQLLGWTHLWSGDGSNPDHQTVRDRLAGWLERCFGARAGSLLVRHRGDLSLATSTPLFAAFLGRRAARELSRQVLRDL